MISSNSEVFKFTRERPEAWLFSCKRVGQQTPKEATSYSGIWSQSDPEFVGKTPAGWSIGRRQRYRMKIVCIVVFSFLFSTVLQAQDAGTNISSGLTTGKYPQPYKRDFSLSSDSGTAPAHSTPSDTVLYNMYGDLREDNPEYNQKSPLWLCAMRVVMNNVVTWASDRYLLNADYARIGSSSWKRNLATGPVSVVRCKQPINHTTPLVPCLSMRYVISQNDWTLIHITSSTNCKGTQLKQ